MGIVQTDALVGAAQAEPASGVIAEITEQRWLALARDLISAGRPAAENPLDPDIPGRIIDDIAVPIERPRVEDVMFLPEFNEIKRRCFEHIRRESTSAFAQPQLV